MLSYLVMVDAVDARVLPRMDAWMGATMDWWGKTTWNVRNNQIHWSSRCWRLAPLVKQRRKEKKQKETREKRVDIR